MDAEKGESSEIPDRSSIVAVKLEALQKQIQTFKDETIDEYIEFNSTSGTIHRATIQKMVDKAESILIPQLSQEVQTAMNDNYGYKNDLGKLCDDVSGWFQNTEEKLEEALSKLKLRSTQLTISNGYYETQLERAKVQNVRKSNFQTQYELMKEASIKCAEIRKERHSQSIAVKLSEQQEQAKRRREQKEAEKEEKMKQLEMELEERREAKRRLQFRNRISYSSAAAKLRQPNPVLHAQQFPSFDSSTDSSEDSTTEEEEMEEKPDRSTRLQSVVVVPWDTERLPPTMKSVVVDPSKLKPIPKPTMKSIAVDPNRWKPIPKPTMKSVVVDPSKLKPIPRPTMKSVAVDPSQLKPIPQPTLKSIVVKPAEKTKVAHKASRTCQGSSTKDRADVKKRDHADDESSGATAKRRKITY
ncbi:hypothetical protein CAEBREN_24152 [Caenorhabditis brenneri]|uniref:Uncharacterized protein n=1 Tax=Caenorhabditis brenneri TaxID=135651 RepID=G0PBF5_CAEBE|nr:hypothetical protein CAEBREN_24152 [Caenorhabditis brenneri]